MVIDKQHAFLFTHFYHFWFLYRCSVQIKPISMFYIVIGKSNSLVSSWAQLIFYLKHLLIDDYLSCRIDIDFVESLRNSNSDNNRLQTNDRLLLMLRHKISNSHQSTDLNISGFTLETGNRQKNSNYTIIEYKVWEFGGGSLMGRIYSGGSAEVSPELPSVLNIYFFQSFLGCKF